MPTETTAQVEQLPNAPDEGDYQAFCDALSASARGRAFLAAYARRNRNADTEQLLAAIGRLQSLVATPATPQTSETIKQELRALHDDIVMAQCELDARILATKAAKLAELMALVERRIANMLEAPGREVNLVIEAPPRHLNRRPSRLKIPNARISRWCRYPSSRNCQSPRRLRRNPRQSRSCAARRSWRRSHSLSHRPRLVLTPRRRRSTRL